MGNDRLLSYDSEIQAMIDELIEMKQRSPRVSGRDSERAGELFVTLRRRGFTVPEMSKMTGVVWKVAAIKPYVAGIQPDKDSKGPQADLSSLAEARKQGLTNEMIEQATSIKKVLDDQNVAFKDIAALVNEIINGGMSIADFVSTVRQLKASDIPIIDLGKTMNFKKTLERIGIDTTMLGKLVDTIARQGNLENTIQLVSTLGPLNEVQAELADLDKTKENLLTRLSTIKNEIAKLEAKKSEISAALELHRQLVERGLTQDILDKILQASQKYGPAENVLDAINQHGSSTNLAKKIREMQSNTNNVEANMKKMEAAYLHLVEVTTMCDTLLKLGFSVEAIRDIYNIAMQFGEPIKVIKEIDKHGKIAEFELKIFTLGAENQQLQKKVVDYEEIKRQRDEAVKATTSLDETAMNMLLEIVEQFERSPSVRTFRKQLVDSGLTTRLESLIEQEVTKRTSAANNQELIMIFQDAVKKQVEKWLSYWPTKILGRRNERKENKLKEKLLATPFVALKGEWRIDCGECGDLGLHILKLNTIYDIETLLRKRDVQVAESGPLSTVNPHSVRATLSDVIIKYLSKLQ